MRLFVCVNIILFDRIVQSHLFIIDPHIRDLFDMKLFVDADPDIRLARRVERDTKERGRCLENTLNQYLRLVKPAFEEFCLPSKQYADILVPRGSHARVV